jgi:hypothetical protein
LRRCLGHTQGNGHPGRCIAGFSLRRPSRSAERSRRGTLSS